MEKLRAFLATTKKYQFWVLDGATFLISLGCVTIACSSLFQECRERKTKLNTAFENANVPPDQPNQDRIYDAKKKDEQLKKIVWDAWKILYDVQTAKNPFPTEVLGQECKDEFDKVLNDPKAEMPRPYREMYQTYIKDYLPTLQKLIDIRRVKEDPAAAKDHGGQTGSGAAGPLGGAGNNVEYEGLVEWDPNDRAKFEGRFVWEQTPSTLAIVLAQEDLWVCEALLRVIKNCNEGATKDKPSTAVVKRIDHLDIGRDAAAVWTEGERAFSPGGRSMPAPTPSGTPAPTATAPAPVPVAPIGGQAGGQGMGSSMMGPAGGAGGVTSEDQIRQPLVGWRYVDDKGVPLPYDAQRPYYVAHPFAEFKLMPIRMSVVMDQRRISKLLVECANSNMPIEVRRVRILTAGAPTGMSGMTGGQASGGGHAPLGAPGGAQSEDANSLDIPIEIQAEIYIYNPPDRERLGKGAASLPANLAAPAAPSPGPAAVPAVTPPTPPRS
jgi:hypothetical protein